MAVDISHLHNVLKDPTRAKLLELLAERGSLSYVELQTLLQINHTGKLNYHLKVLGDLLVRDEQTGHYSLGEKGAIAVELLSKFQSATAESEAKAQLKVGAMVVSLLAAVILLAYLTQFVPALSDVGRALYGIAWAGVGVFAAWLFGSKNPLRRLIS
jgi:hypothetical protein